MTKTKSQDPRDRLGAYDCLENVPSHHRLIQYHDELRARDVWQEFCEEHEYQCGSSEHFRSKVDRIGEAWCEYMADRPRHHALATPGVIELQSASTTVFRFR